MTEYILRTALCSGVFLAFYFLVLQHERMYRFNRFFLLLSLPFCFLVPLLKIGSSTAPAAPVQDFFPKTGEVVQTLILDPAPSVSSAAHPIATHHGLNPLSPAGMLWTIYLGMTFVLLYRFIKNVLRLFRGIRRGERLNDRGTNLILLDTIVDPFSFMGYIFLNRSDFRNGRIEREIFRHELAHVKQRHSLDILVIELLLIFAWFNPFLLVYRRAIRLNHEFLADEAVIDSFNEPEVYQELLFRKVAVASGTSLSSPFNYLTTKKRLIMMTKEKNSVRAWLMQGALIPFIAGAVMIFSGGKAVSQSSAPPLKSRNFAKVKTVPAEPLKFLEIIQPGPGASTGEMSEYQSIAEKYLGKSKAGVPGGNKFSDEESQRMENIYIKMNSRQRAGQSVIFIKRFPAVPPHPPTASQLSQWKDATTYGIWIDGKRVNNDVLSGYSASDFGQAYVSRLSKNAINYGKHFVQIDLYTKVRFEKDKAEEEILRKKSPYMMMFIRKSGVQTGLRPAI